MPLASDSIGRTLAECNTPSPGYLIYLMRLNATSSFSSSAPIKNDRFNDERLNSTELQPSHITYAMSMDYTCGPLPSIFYHGCGEDTVQQDMYNMVNHGLYRSCGTLAKDQR